MSRKPKTSTTRKGRVLESSVAEIYEAANSLAVQRNVRVPSCDDPTRSREVDVLVTVPTLPAFFRLPIECKNYKRPVGVGKIDEFAGKLDDIGLRCEGAQFVSDRGFTKDALSRAKALKIETLMFEGLTPDGLRTQLCEARGTTVYPVLFLHGFTLDFEAYEANVSDPLIDREQCDCFLNVLSGKYIFAPDLFHGLWNLEDDLLPTSPGIHDQCEIAPQHDLIFNWRGTTWRIKTFRPKLEVRSYAVVHSGEGTNLVLKRTIDGALIRSRRQAKFPRFVDLPITEFRSPEALASFIEEQRAQVNGDWHFERQIKVPRVYYCGNFWPLSRRIKKALKKTTARDLETLHGLIGHDLQTIGWEK